MSAQIHLFLSVRWLYQWYSWSTSLSRYLISQYSPSISSCLKFYPAMAVFSLYYLKKTFFLLHYNFKDFLVHYFLNDYNIQIIIIKVFSSTVIWPFFVGRNLHCAFLQRSCDVCYLGLTHPNYSRHLLMG